VAQTARFPYNQKVVVPMIVALWCNG